MTKKEKTELQDEIVKQIPQKTSGQLHLAPRLGKSRVIIQLIKRDKPLSILWVTPSAELAETDIPNEFNKWGAKKYKNVLTTVTWTSLPKIEENYDLVILDESQKITTSHMMTIHRLMKFGTVLAMTGTPSESLIKKELYKSLGLNIIYSLLIDEAVEQGILADYEVNVISVRLSLENDVHVNTKKGPGFVTSEYKQYQFLTKRFQESKGTRAYKFAVLNRRRAILDSNSKFKVAKQLLDSLSGRKLVFCSSIKQAERFSPLTYHSKTNNNNLESFQKKETEELYLVNTGGIGSTFEDIDHLVVTQVNSDQNGDISQKICRALLKQHKTYKAKIWLLVLEGTQDEIWMGNLLKKFNNEKIKFYKDIKELI